MKSNLMMKYLPVFLMMCVSCVKTGSDITEEQPSSCEDLNMVEMTFRALVEDPNVKTSIDLEQKTVSWTAGDRIKFNYEVAKVSHTPVISEPLDAESVDAAVFKAQLPDVFAMTEAEYNKTLGQGEVNSRHLYAIYPADIETDYSTASEYLVRVPAVQDGAFENASVSIAKWDSKNPDAPLDFYNMCALLQFVIEDARVMKVEFSSKSDIAGNVSVTFDGKKPVVKQVKAGEKKITVNVNGAGTYYAAVLPGEIEDMYVALYNGSDELIGDRISKTLIPVARKQIRKLGKISTGFEGRYYVKTSSAGKGDGSDWDNAADYSALVSKLKNDKSRLDVYMAAGIYNVSEIADFGTGTASASYSIFGGYSPESAGCSVADRNFRDNITVLDGGEKTRIWCLRRGQWFIDGITFRNAKASGAATGSALLIESNATSSFEIRNCTFNNNENSGTVGGGAVRVAGAPVKMTNCTFKDNVAAKDAGAVYVADGGSLSMDGCSFVSNKAGQYGGAIANKGVMNAVNCDFDSNNAEKSAGAVYTLSSSDSKFNLCTFRLNKTALTDENSVGGGAVWATETSTVFFNRCFFANNEDQYNAHHIYSGANSRVGLNNCVVRGPWGITKKQGSLLQLKGSNVIVNSTIYCQTGSWGAVSLGSKNPDGCRIINDIVINKSSAQYSFYSTSYYMQVYNSIYSESKSTDASYGHTFTDCLKSASCRDQGNFPKTGAVWSVDGTKFNLDGSRYIYVYEWDGVTDAGEVKHIGLSEVMTLIKGTSGVGEDFLSWLESQELEVDGTKALAMDIRGEKRNISSMWPGSYEN